MGSDELFVRKASGLVREIGAFSVMAMAANYVIADGFYLFTTGLGYSAPGANIPLALLIGGIMMTLAALAVVLLTMAMPRTASDYVGISRVLHPLLGYIEAILVFGVHIWIVGALSYFMAFFWGSAIIQIGLAIGNRGIVSTGEWLSTDVGATVALGVLFVVLFGLISLLGVRVFKYIVNALFLLALGAGIVTIAGAAYAALLSPGQIKALWDMTYGAGAYDEIMRLAETTGWKEYVASAAGDATRWGWPGPWSLEVTLSLSIVVAAYAFWGLEYANYMAGEIDKPKRNFFIGTIGAIIVVFAYYLSISALTLLGFREFFSAYQYVMNTEAANQLTINPVQTPTWAVFIASLFGGWAPILAIIITLAVPLWVMNGIPVYMMVPSRIAFALSFDRFFPEKLAEVNDRFRTPHWSIALVMLGAVLMIAVLASPDFGPLFYAITAVTAVSVRWFLSAIATTILPYRRPAIFKEGYAKTIGPVPVVSVIGGAATVSTLIILILGLQQVAADATLVSPLWMIGWLLLAVALYAYYNWANKKRGIQTEKIFGEVPPA